MAHSKNDILRVIRVCARNLHKFRSSPNGDAKPYIQTEIFPAGAGLQEAQVPYVMALSYESHSRRTIRGRQQRRRIEERFFFLFACYGLLVPPTSYLES